MNKIAVIGLTGTSVFLGVDHFHGKGETVHAKDMHIEYGGKGFNQAVAAARQGAEVSFLSAVGKADVRPVTALLSSEKIHFVPAEKDIPSAYAVIMTDKNGDNQVTVYPGAHLDKEDVALFEMEIASADILLLTNEVPECVNILAAECARKNGVKIIFNPAPARPLPDSLLGATWLFTPNEAEAASIPQSANAIVTLGANGCFIRSTVRHIPPVSFGKVVDTTGAGDTFNGVLAACLANGKTLQESAETANRAAAKSVTIRYVLPSIPYSISKSTL